MDGKRSFKIVSAKKSNGCDTKFPGKSRFVSRTPASAAKKALTALCSVKKIRGVCTLYITVKETTRGSSGKHYTYMCKRIKLKTPKIIKDVNGNELYKVEYESVCKAHKGGVKVAKGVVCKKTSGVISKKSKLKRRQKGGATTKQTKTATIILDNGEELPEQTYSVIRKNGSVTSIKYGNNNVIWDSNSGPKNELAKKVLELFNQKSHSKHNILSRVEKKLKKFNHSN